MKSKGILFHQRQKLFFYFAPNSLRQIREKRPGMDGTNPILFVACAECNRPYSEMLTYKLLTSNAVFFK
jgi:hypothetical protein